MKIKLISAAILASMSVMSAAQAQVSVYGLVDVGFAHTDTGPGTAVDKASFSNNSTTKVGLKGSTDLGSGITGSVNLESGATVTGPNLTQFGMFDRQAWIGMAGSFGEARIGLQDSVANKTLIGFDLNGAANDTAPSLLPGTVFSASGQNALAGTKEFINYISPVVMGGLQFSLGLTLKGNALDVNTRLGTPDNLSKTNIAVGASYSKGPLAAGLAIETASTDDTTKLNSNTYIGLGASYDFGMAKVSGIYADGGRTAAGLSGRGFQLGVSAPVAGVTVGMQYARNLDTFVTGTEVFINKEVLKNTTAYFEYGLGKPAAGNETTKYSAGLIYVF